jgi:hypothetical protein
MSEIEQITIDESHEPKIYELVEEFEKITKEKFGDNDFTKENIAIILHAIILILQRILMYQSSETIENTRDIFNYVCDLFHKKGS